MAQAGVPNPIELYEGARDYMLPILGAVESSDLTNATPCAEWNVKQLINHNLLVAEVVYRLLTGREMVNPFAVDKDLPEEGAKEAFRVATDRVLSAIKQPKAPEEVISTPFGEMPAGEFLLFPFGDILIHKWDLAKATGQDTSMDSSMADACLRVFSGNIEDGRKNGAFGPEVPVSVDASSQNRLLGLTGRTPEYPAA